MSSTEAAETSAASGGGGGEGSSKVSPGKEKKVSDKDVDLTSASRGVWLVKVPNYIAERWEASESNATVGKLTIKRNPGAKPSVALHLEDKITQARPKEEGEGEMEWATTKGPIPKEHKFVVNPVAAQHLAILSNTKGGKGPADKLAVEGRVIQRAECRAVDEGLYMRLKREALLAPQEKARKAQKINKLVISEFNKPKTNHANNIAYDKRVKEEGKKSRDDKEAVMEKLFALFEKHQYYNFTDLVKETRQPVPHLKSILNDICKYNLKNPHRNMWELKPEYRHYKHSAAAASADDKDDDDDDEEGGKAKGSDSD